MILPGFNKEECINQPTEEDVKETPANEATKPAEEAGKTTTEEVGKNVAQDLLPSFDVLFLHFLVRTL